MENRLSKALLVILAVAFLGPFGGNMLLPMFRSIKQSYDVGIFLVGIGITSYMVPFSLFQLFSGAISDVVYGRRKVIVTGLTLYAVGAVGASLSPTILAFLTFRAIQGTGNALALPVAMALAGDIYPKEVRGRIMGLVAISTTLGAMLGPLFGGAVSSLNWRVGFATLAMLALAFGLIFHLTFREELRGSGTLREAASLLRSSLTDLRILIIGFLGFTIFFVRVGTFTYLSDLLTLPPYEYSDEAIAFYLALPGLGGLLTGHAAGYLTDRVGRWRTALLGFGSLEALMLSFMGDWPRYLALLMFLYGALSTVAVTALNTLIVEVDPSKRATASSIYGSLRFLGFALAPALLYPAYKVYLFEGIVSICLLIMLASLVLAISLKRFV